MLLSGYPPPKSCDAFFTGLDNVRSRVRVFCFPYAGGGASCFKSWVKSFPASIEVRCAQLRGRESRIREAPVASIADIVEEAAMAMRGLEEKPFVLFGHSMGSLICFELARYLKRNGRPEPLCLFLSGRKAPQIPNTDTPPSYNLPHPEFLEELKKLKGTPPELLENAEIMEILLPVLRADFQACQTYEYCTGDSFDYPITIFGGIDDEISPEQLQEWQLHTTGDFQMHLFEGGHFFIRAQEQHVLTLIAQRLSQIGVFNSYY